MKSEVVWKPTIKQKIAFDYLQDQTTTELFYGGGAGGGKTYLGCLWIALSCIRYPGSRWVIGRAELKSLKASTLLTFFDILREWGLETEKDYRYNQIDGIIAFWNGSTVYLHGLKTEPSDPEFDKLGSTEYTGAFIDECSQVSTKAKNIVMSRLRYKLEEFQLVPKLLMCSNPTKNFLYYDFYKPSKNGELIEYRKFVPALVTDNPYISPFYIENLKKLDKVTKERLLYGNFEYDDDPAKLFEYDNIVNMFTNSYVENSKEKVYLSVDVARFGSDNTILTVWRGFYVVKVLVYSKNSIEDNKRIVLETAAKYSIPRSQIIIDEDGVGGGLVDSLPGVKGFVNNSRPYVKETIPGKRPVLHNFGNLKAQCYFSFAASVNSNEVGIYEEIPVEYKDLIIEELEQVKRKDPDKDSKIYITPKEEIKEKLGRSPDFADSLMMRWYFEVLPVKDYRPLFA